ncbi:hypothetical protein EXIGLDRAFT_723619 [Exidia glandulosa HHB12029]|uniref:Uncharacterized protein n=1 Tax=Exidia glandulosa HHB12029 TaxID=1314781 RepID=A0A165ESU6_EXIGL|nr:hypothetical protein EXIGLDRAFT_723619 [Exidia glandulosa HHB12029]
MSTSRALITTKKSSWKDPALTGALLALKIAKEATGDVPIVKQIVGVALSIVEIAEKAEKNRDALCMLAEKAATLAQRVKQVVTDRPVNGQLVAILEHLTLVLDKVEAFMLKETVKSNAVTKIYRGLFVLQHKVDELANEMQTEIEGFMMAALVDTRLYLAENAQHDGQFALLRDYQVRKLGVILERETEHGTVAYAKARVDGVSELMVVKYLKGGVQTGLTSDAWSASTEDIMTQVSTLELSHPNVAQFYGRGRRDGTTRFLVLRTGAYHAEHYLSQSCLNDTERFPEYYRMRIYVLAASAHLEGMGIAWFPRSLSQILVDDHGQPYIGALDDLVSSERCSRPDQAAWVFWCLSQLRRLAAPAHVHCKEAASPESCDNGLLKACMESNISYSPILHQVWARICAEELYIEIATQEEPFADFSQLSPVTISEAKRHNNDLFSSQYPPIQQQLNSVATIPQDNNELNDGRIEEESLEVQFECQLVFDSEFLGGYHILHGFRSMLAYCTETGYIYKSYIIDLPKEVAADMCMILHDVDDPEEALDLFSYCEFFHGVARVPLALM